jgi:hypothetical protein
VSLLDKKLDRNSVLTEEKIDKVGARYDRDSFVQETCILKFSAARAMKQCISTYVVVQREYAWIGTPLSASLIGKFIYTFYGTIFDSYWGCLTVVGSKSYCSFQEPTSGSCM